MAKNSPIIQGLKLAAVLLTLFFVVSGYMTLTSKQNSNPNNAIANASPTRSATATATHTATGELETATATATQTPSATATKTPTSTNSPTPTTAPTNTPTLTPTATQTPTQPTPTETATETPASAETLTETATPLPTDTPSGPPTETPTPTITPTPVPRTVKADAIPDYTQAEAHLRFTRPFTDAYATWGSWYYPYGTNNNGQYLWHRGIDIQNPELTPVIAVGAGQVIFADTDLSRAVGPQTNFYGQAVIVQHQPWQNATQPNPDSLPVYTLYGHVEKVLVQPGQTVEAGQPIALTGQRGVALGPHLHLEVRLGENSYLSTQNPDLWVQPDPGYGIIAGRVIDVNGFYVPQQLITLHRAETPNKFWRQTWTYPDHRYTFDPQLGETFTFADVVAGEYIVKTTFDGRTYSLPITVTAQSLSFALIEGREPPPPKPESTPTPESTGEPAAAADSTPTPASE